MKRALTSASNIFRRKLCPGSAAMEAPFGEVDSEYSAEGIMLHKLFLTGQRPDTLTAEQSQTLDLGDYYAESFIASVREQFGIPADEPFVDEREVEIQFVALEGYDMFPGHADLIRTWPKRSVRAIVDAKYGVMEVDHAADNLQLASYAVMSFQARPADFIAVGISQPRNYGPRFSSAVYDCHSIEMAHGELQGIVLASQEDNAPLNAGEKQCHFCKSKAICPAYKAQFEGPLAVVAVMPRAIQSLPPSDLERLHVAIAFANKIKDEVSAEMRARVAAGQMPGWRLGNSGDDVTLNDALGFFAALQDAMPEGVTLTAGEFDDLRVLQWGDLTTLIQTKLKVSEKRAKEIIRDLSAPYTTRTPKQPRVVREKGVKANQLPDEGTIGYVYGVPQIDGQE